MRCITALALALFSWSTWAADPAPPASTYLEGREYIQLEAPVRTQDPSKIEVAEVFSYICPHCYHFEALISAWGKTQKSDVVIVQTHLNWGAATAAYQRGYYTATLLKVKEKTHQAIFDHIHRDNKPLPNAEAWADFLSGYGVTKQAVLTSFDSFAVNSLIAQADARTRAYQISSTPELVVDGKYRVSSRQLSSQEEMLKVAQFLVDKIRAERAATK